MANASLGWLSPEHAELLPQPPRASVRRRRPGGLPDRSRDGGTSRALRGEQRRAGAYGSSRPEARAARGGASSCRHPTARSRPRTSWSPRARSSDRPHGLRADIRSPGILQLHASEYRRPDQLPPGAVLVVGSGQSGCQIANELNADGRSVYLSLGRCPSVPLFYRGRQFARWAIDLGLMEDTVDSLPSQDARLLCNPVVGHADGGHLCDPQRLAREGVVLIGRIEATRRIDRPRDPRRERTAGRGGRVCRGIQATGGCVRRGLRPGRSRSARRRGRPGGRERRAGTRPRAPQASARSSGRTATGPTSAGSTCPSSTEPDGLSRRAA